MLGNRRNRARRRDAISLPLLIRPRSSASLPSALSGNGTSSPHGFSLVMPTGTEKLHCMRASRPACHYCQRSRAKPALICGGCSHGIHFPPRLSFDLPSSPNSYAPRAGAPIGRARRPDSATRLSPSFSAFHACRVTASGAAHPFQLPSSMTWGHRGIFLHRRFVGAAESAESAEAPADVQVDVQVDVQLCIEAARSTCWMPETA